MIDRLEAVEIALQAHDGMQRLIREDGLPIEAVDSARGFIAGLNAIGFDVVPVKLDPDPRHVDEDDPPPDQRSGACLITIVAGALLLDLLIAAVVAGIVAYVMAPGR